MSKGISAPANCASHITCLREAGYQFACRYYCISTRIEGKKITHDEAVTLSHSGIRLVAVWENGSPDHTDYFSYTKGVHDGVSAYHYGIDVIRQPPGSPIYFAVDYDASSSAISGAIADYFRGVRDGFHTYSSGHPVYDVGVYGSGKTCSWIKAHMPFVTYFWLANSPGWSGHESFTDWNLKQGPNQLICGLDAEPNESRGHGGGFLVSS